MNEPKPSVLRVAYPSTRNAQQTAFESDVARNSHATAAQQPSLKALALLALSRNNRATVTQQQPELTQKTAQRTEDQNSIARNDRSAPAAAVAGLRIVEFRLFCDRPGAWHTALGPDADDLLHDLRDRFGERLEAVKLKP